VYNKLQISHGFFEHQPIPVILKHSEGF